MLVKVLAEHVKKSKLHKPDPITVIKIVKRNIKWTPLKNYPNGSLDYDFAFNDITSDEQAQNVLDKIRKEKLLNQVNIS